MKSTQPLEMCRTYIAQSILFYFPARAIELFCSYGVELLKYVQQLDGMWRSDKLIITELSLYKFHSRKRSPSEIYDLNTNKKYNLNQWFWFFFFFRGALHLFKNIVLIHVQKIAQE